MTALWVRGFALAMKSLLFAAAFSLILVSPSWAQIEIRKARFGQDDDHRDVRGIVNEFIREGRLSFRVTSSNMGGDVTPRTTDYFYVVYKSNGQEYTQSVAEGDVFTFKGVNTRPVVDPEVGSRLPTLWIAKGGGYGNRNSPRMKCCALRLLWGNSGNSRIAATSRSAASQ